MEQTVEIITRGAHVETATTTTTTTTTTIIPGSSSVQYSDSLTILSFLRHPIICFVCRLIINQGVCHSLSFSLSLSLHVAACCAVRKRCVTKGILLYANNFDRNFMIVFRITINHETMRRGDVSKSYEDDR